MLSVGLLVLVLMGIVTVAVNDHLAGLLLREARIRGVAVAHSIGATTANSLLNYDYLSLNQAAEKAVIEEEIAYVIVLDKEGKVAAHSERPDLVGLDLPEEPPAHGFSQQEHDTVRLREIGSGDARTRILDVSHGVFFDGSDVQWGTIRVGLDLAGMEAAVRRVRLILGGIGLWAIVLALFGARVISRRITASLDDLIRGTIAVSQGDLDHRIEVDTADEIGALASHFNHMTSQVKKQQNEIAVAKRELEILNATLEEKVAQRTREFLASEEKYRTLVDSSPDPILIVQDGRIRFVNPAFEASFGYVGGQDGDEALTVERLFHAEDRERAEYFLELVQGGETVEAGEIRGVARSGAVRLFEMRGMTIHYLGQPAVEILLTDTTERKELQEHLLQHEKLRALGELAGGVAHDFNNILGIILGRSQLLQRAVGDEEVRRGLQTIERAAFDGGETVRRIQDFARSRTERDFELVDLNTLLQETVEITRTRWKDQAEMHDVRIDVTLERGAIPPVRGNASELREIYTNLIFNAVDAMPDGGSILLRSRADGGDVVVEVRDTGQGMDDFVRSRIFDPFFTTKGTKGMGLGMSVVYGIVERHKGKITVESALQKGTCFAIRMPAGSPEDREKSVEMLAPEATAARILVIDDERDIVELVADILEAHGHRVRSAVSGSEGLELLEQEEFDLLLCDLGMREMTGWEVVRAVRERDDGIGVVLITGWGATLSVEKVADHGIDAVLAKPFQMKKLLETVAEVLRLCGERRSATAG